jgi:hypothetical protein
MAIHGKLLQSRLLVLSALMAGAAMMAPQGANAAALYWTKTPVKSASFKTCLSFASSAMRAAGMQSIRVSAMEVAGSRGAMYAAITCFSTAPRASAIVMAVGDDLAETRRLSEELQGKIARVTIIDDSQ